MKAFRVCYVASELAPLTGSGDFAKEVHFLSRAMADLGMDVTLVVPGYRAPDPTAFGMARRLTPLLVNTASTQFESTVHEGNLAGGRVKVFVLTTPGTDSEEAVQADAFCHAALALVTREGLAPDVVCAGPGTEQILAMIKTQRTADGRPPVALHALRDLANHVALTVALPHADRIVVSSPSLAASLRQQPDSEPLGRLLAPVRHAIFGITPGVDFVTWNPQHDRLEVSNIVASKAEHKRQLKRRLGLRGGSQAPLVALIGPFDDQVLTEAAAEELAHCDALLVVLAHAERDRSACERFADLARHGRGVLRAAADEREFHTFEHELLCAADFAVFARGFSQTAPNELYCMHYGVAPIAPNTAGFADILVQFDTRTTTGSGFLFNPAQDRQLAAAIERALRAYRQPGAFAALVTRLAQFDLSWRTTAHRYADLVRQVVRERSAESPAVQPAAQPDAQPATQL